MQDTDQTPAAESRPKGRRRAAAAALLVAGAVGGGVLANTIGASADTTTSSTPGASSSPAAGGAPSGKGPGPGGAASVRSDEKVVTGTTAATLKAAALKAVPGGTVIRAETDAGDAAYEVHMKKTDGTLVTVKFDKNLTLTKVETGMGQGDPVPQGARPGGVAPTSAPTSGT